jgi:predicted phosphoribosyltransferase
MDASNPPRLPFPDRRAAGRELAVALAPLQGNPQVVVLGIPRGGVVVAAVVAGALAVPLDVFITHKLGAPMNSELAIGAVASDGTAVLDHSLVRYLHLSKRWIEQERERQQREIQRRMEVYRRGKPPLVLENKIVILVDDGVATGATTVAALRALQVQHPRRRILAVPVAPRQVVRSLQVECDELVLLEAPHPFDAVGAFYTNFEQVTDEQVVALLQATASS